MIALGVSALTFDDPAGFTAPAAFGPFRVLHQIGSGVLGPVFRTFDPEQEKLVAVKVFRLDVVPEISARLAVILKKMAAAPVKHPAVVGILDAGLEGTTAFLAMEYVAAETLDVSLRRFAPASLEIATPMLRQVAEALEAGWAAGMGHGALHPRDIFVLPPATELPHGQTVIRVSGFGVTDALEELRIPTPVRRPYTAPEREHAGEWDIRADVYSLGVIAHELLTGRRPSDSLELDAELPEGTLPDERVAIRRALAGALATDPQERYETPMAFIEALTIEVIPEEAPEPTSEAPMLPWMTEPGDDAEVEPIAAGELDDEFEDDRDAEPEMEPEPEVEPESESIWVPGPEPETEPEPERARSTVTSPSFLGVSSQPDRREPFQPFIDAPKESEMPRTLAAVAIALAVGIGIGYWWRGPALAPAPEVTSPSPTATSVTKAPEEPIGTDVAVNEPSKAAPSRTPAATPTPAATTPAAPVATRGPSRVPPAKAGATTGSVRVETRPSGARVLIDGRSVGSTPLSVPKLAAGSHTVRVSLAGHKTVTTTTVVRAGQQTLLRLSLEIQ